MTLLGFITNAQSLKQCNCLTCTDTINDNSKLVIDFDIKGATNNDLSSASQGLCKVYLKFTHEFISDMTMKLVSPIGQEVNLIGPYFNNNSASLTKGTRWDITFVDTFTTPMPDTTYALVWNNAQPWSIFSQYYGTYLPYKGNLNDFNKGTVNGKWQLIIEDFGPDLIPKTGLLEYAQLQFCDEAGLNCKVCRSDAGTLNGVQPLNFCQQDSIIIPILPKFDKGIPNPELYALNYIISKDSTIVSIQNSKQVNLTNFPPGKYLINSFSYAKLDSAKTFFANNNIKFKTLIDSINSISYNFCGKISDSSVIINIYPIIKITNKIDKCEGTTYTIGKNTYSSTGIYSDTLTTIQGCDSIVITDITFHPKFDTLIRINICKIDTLRFGNQLFSKSGLYNIKFTSQYGCDSSYNILLSLKDSLFTSLYETRCFGDTFFLNNKSYTTSGKYFIYLKSKGGCDSIVELNLTIKPKLSSVINRYICDGDSITIGKSVYYTSGPKLDTLITALGCDSLIYLNLFVGSERIKVIDTSICQGGFVTFKNQNLFISGTYSDTVKVKNSCDSITILNLKVKQKPKTNLVKIICTGQFYKLGNKLYYQTGLYSDTTFSNSPNICDSITNLYLFVKDIQTYNYNITLCEGETYQIGDSTYKSTGLVQDTISTIDGCDSLIKVSIKVIPKQFTAQNLAICKGQTLKVGLSIYSKSGTYIDTLDTKSTGCDSIVTTNLVVLDRFESNQTIVKCAGDTIQIGKKIFTKSQNYIDSFISSGGCDSLINYNLVFKPTYNDTIARQICSNQTYTFNNIKYNKPGVYTNKFISSTYQCDSSITLLLTVTDTFSKQVDTTICEGKKIAIGSSIYDKTGFYINTFSNSVGCDSTIYLNLKVMANPVDTLVKTICRGEIVKIGNSIYTQSGFYKEIISTPNLCDSVRYLNLTVIDSIVTQDTRILCLGDSILFGKQIIKSGGDFRGKFFNIYGCDSIVYLKVIEKAKPNPIRIQTEVCALDSIEFYGKTYKGLGNIKDTLRLSDKDGCDTLVFLNLNFITKFSKNIDTSICEGSYVQVNNIKYNQSGFYKINLISKAGCDSIINLNLKVNPNSNTIIDTTICVKDSIKIGTTSFFNAGNYEVVLKNKFNCDSTIYLNLKKNTYFISETYKEICEGDSVRFGKLICKTSGTYTDTIKSATTCDSLKILKLLVNFSQTVRIEKNICNGDSVLIHGKYYSDNTNTNFFINNPNGCDTTIYIKVNKLPKYYNKLNVTYCEGDSVNVFGKYYKSEGVYFLNNVSVYGCDSITELTVKKNPTYQMVKNATICSNETYTIGGKDFKSAGTYNILDKTIDGCDSITTLNLNVIDFVKIKLDVQKCMGDSYQFGNKLILKSGLYVDTIRNTLSCDSIKTLDINFVDTIFQRVDSSICEGNWISYNNQKLDKAGLYSFGYKSQFNCDSVYQINLTIKSILRDTLNITQCENLDFDFYGTKITKSGFYNKSFTSNIYCDSIIILHYQTTPISTKMISASICDNDSVIINNKIYKSGGSFTDTIFNSISCDTFLQITIIQIPKIITTVNSNYCEGDTISLNNKKIYATTSFTDTLKTTNNCDSIINYNLVFNSKSYTNIKKTVCENDTLNAGVYVFKYQNQFGCDSIVTLTVTKIICNIESIFTTYDASCSDKPDGKVLIRIINGAPPFKYSWKDLKDKLYDKTMIGYVDSITNLLPGNYAISISDNNNNQQIKNALVKSPPPLVAKIAAIPSYGNYQLKCTNSQDGYATISVNGGTSNYRFLWSNGATTQDLDKLVAGSYQLSITDSNGCLDTSIQIQLNAPPLPNIEIVKSDPKCFGESNGEVQINIDNSKAPYTFSFNNEKYDTSHIYQNLRSGIYFVKIQDKYGCLYEQQVKLVQPEKLSVDLGADFEIVIGSTAKLTATITLPSNEIENIMWSNGKSCFDCDTIMVSPTTNALYSVKVKSKNGCIATDEINISVNEKPNIEMPNAITPNEDGLNDVFFLDFLANNSNAFPDNELAIYNRWGDMVFRAKPYLNNWKGTNQNGSLLPAGTYYYILRLNLNNGSVYQGDITILK